MSERASELVSERASERASEQVSERASERVSGRASEWASERAGGGRVSGRGRREESRARAAGQHSGAQYGSRLVWRGRYASSPLRCTGQRSKIFILIIGRESGSSSCGTCRVSRRPSHRSSSGWHGVHRRRRRCRSRNSRLVGGCRATASTPTSLLHPARRLRTCSQFATGDVSPRRRPEILSR